MSGANEGGIPAPLQSTPDVSGDPMPGGLGQVGAYDLLVELASGGMATVYLARSPDGRLTAIKRPHPHLARDPIYTSMLLDEARLASAIQHPNVVRVRELGFEGDLPFIVMDYVEGASLVEVRRELASVDRALDVPVALRIALDALGGLHAAHLLKDEAGRPLGIIHRDVSPHNVLVGADGVARLTDFGIAKAEDRVQVTRTHEVKGKLAYMAPERVDYRRACTVQSDVFAMGVVLWESLAGRRLFRGEEPAHVLDAVIHAPIPRLRKVGALHVSPELDDVIARALARDVAHRYATAADFAAALEAVARGHVASRADVGRVIEAVFAPRLRVLHEAVRRVAGEEEAESLLGATGVRPRPRPSPAMPLSTPEIFGAIGTDVPTDRYVIDAVPDPAKVIRQRKQRKVLVVGAIVAVALVVAIGTVVGLARRASHPRDVAPIAELRARPVEPPAPRRVVVVLPFAASRVALDDEDRILATPSDTVMFEVAPERAVEHKLAASAEDGSSAEGTVTEDNGVARADGPGMLVLRPVAKPAASGRPRNNNLGTRRNGFTKLK